MFVFVFVSILVSCTRVVDPDPFISFIPTAFFAPGYADRGRTSARTHPLRFVHSDGVASSGVGQTRMHAVRLDSLETLDGWIPIRAGDRDCVIAMRRRRVRDRGDDGGWILVIRSSTMGAIGRGGLHAVVLVL